MVPCIIPIFQSNWGSLDDLTKFSGCYTFGTRGVVLFLRIKILVIMDISEIYRRIFWEKNIDRLKIDQNSSECKKNRI